MRSLFHQVNRMRYILAVAFVLSVFLMTSCDSSPGSAGPFVTNGGKGCTKVGVLLPETSSSARWESKDHPLLLQAVQAAIPGVHIDYNNAQGNSNLQLHQAEADLANGDCILIVGAHDSVAAAVIVAKARAQNVPVIAYDRMIESKDLNYYVSFDNIKVGHLQGQYIAEHYLAYAKKNSPANIMMINGSQTDNNALLFSEGAHIMLDPLFGSGALNNIYEIFTPNWDNNFAQSEAETDATAAGINAILLGYQSMTVYKPIAQEARSAGDLVRAIFEGTDTANLTHGATTASYDGGLIPSILDQPVMVDRTNIKSTVIADSFLTRSEVCQGVPRGTDGVC